MKKTYLFPTYFKKIGWIIVLANLLFILICYTIKQDLELEFKTIALVANSNNNFLGTDLTFFTIAKTNFMLTLFPVFMIVGFLFIAFSKEKDEDEYISKIREQSLVWSVLITSLILILSILFIYGWLALYIFWFDFLLFILVFVIKFRVEIFRFKRSIKKNEE